MSLRFLFKGTCLTLVLVSTSHFYAQDGKTALLKAAENGLETCQCLMKHAASVDFQDAVRNNP